jgi:hypothetical protein
VLPDALLPTATSRLVLGVGIGGCRQKLLSAVVSAKAELLSIAFGVGSIVASVRHFAFTESHLQNVRPLCRWLETAAK